MCECARLGLSGGKVVAEVGRVEEVKGKGMVVVVVVVVIPQPISPPVLLVWVLVLVLLVEVVGVLGACAYART